MKNRDTNACLELIDNSCIVTGAQGAATLDQNLFRQMMAGGAFTIDGMS